MSDIATSAQSDIAALQKTEAHLRFLKARQWQWKVAERWQLLQIVVVLAAPLSAITLGVAKPELRPWIALLAVCLTVADTAWVDRSYKEALRVAAKASELFDTVLLRLPWSTLGAGKKPPPEETDRAARGWEGLKNPYPIEDWYSPEVDRAPLALARVICQRTNLSYDASLRRLNRALLAGAATVISLAVVTLGLFSSQGFAEWVLAAGVPAAPFVAWALRERYRQADAVAANEPVLAETERLLDDIIENRCNMAEAKARSREIQTAIYSSRARTVLLFPKLYKIRRGVSEADMHAGAQYWIERAGL